MNRRFDEGLGYPGTRLTAPVAILYCATRYFIKKSKEHKYRKIKNVF